MTLEKELISKTYYQSLINGDHNGEPISALGEMYMNELKNEMPDLSSIRFAQGEVYFHNKDYEAAIFKWESISEDLKPWAQKNIADAHIELNLLAIAEEYYLSVETESDVLKIEVLLQMFSLYIQLRKDDLAVATIKKAIALNPDYSDVTDIARSYFEAHQDWDNAVELAIQESIRTEALQWFDILEDYVTKGYTSNVKPNKFIEVLKRLFYIDHVRFEKLTMVLWSMYKQTALYFSWVKEINHLLLNMETEQEVTWNKLPTLYKDTYFELISGKILIKEFSDLIPDHFYNWMKMSTASDAIVSSTAVLAWNETFPSHIDQSIVDQAENVVKQQGDNPNILEAGFGLFESILKWAEEEDVSVPKSMDWMVHELLDSNQFKLLIMGAANSGKDAFVNQVIDEEIMDDSASATVLLQDAEKFDVFMITDEEIKTISHFEEFRRESRNVKDLIGFRMPISFLNENNLTLINMPGFGYQSKLINNLNQYTQVADCILFVLNTDSSMINKDLDLAVRVKEQVPERPIHFVLWNMNSMAKSQDTMERVENTVTRIDEVFQNAQITSLSIFDEREAQLRTVSSLVKSMKKEMNLEDMRTSKLLFYIKHLITYLLEKRTEKENDLIENIKWQEEIVVKLQGAKHQLGDMEEEKVKVIKNSFSQVKNDLKQEMLIKIPELLRKSSDVVKEDSDFGKLHVELNEEMNTRITHYMEENVLHDFKRALQGWIQECEEAFKDSQTYLDEMSDSFNQLYGEEKMLLGCDFKVLSDWQRDIDRMTRGPVQLNKVNIMMRFTPSQLLLKGAGMLFGAIPKNKEMLQHRYKQFIETTDYSQTAESITDHFLQQFELFEHALERDINMFFTKPNEMLKRTLEETYDDIENDNNALSMIRKNPEIYRDPLTLFGLRLRQYEWMNTASVAIHEYR